MRPALRPERHARRRRHQQEARILVTGIVERIEAARDRLADQNAWLEAEVRNRDTLAARYSGLRALASSQRPPSRKKTLIIYYCITAIFIFLFFNRKQ